MTALLTPTGNQTFSLDQVARSSAFYGALPESLRQELEAGFVTDEVSAGHLVFREGQPADRYYLIGRGSVELWESHGRLRSAPEGTDDPAWRPDPGSHTRIAVLGPGDGFGEMALLLGGPRRVTAVALTDVSLYALPGDVFAREVDEHRGLAVAFEHELALRVVATAAGRSSVFGQLAPEDLRWLALRLSSVAVAAGETVISQGDPGDAFYLVRNGSFAMTEAGAGGEHALAILTTGDAFGEDSLLSGQAHTASVCALEPGAVLRLARADFEAVVRKNAAVARYLLQLFVQRQRPRRREGCRIEQRQGRHGGAVYILEDPSQGRYLKLSEAGAFLFGLMDGEHTLRDLSLAYLERFHVFGVDAVLGCIMELAHAGFVEVEQVQPGVVQTLSSAGWRHRLALAVLPWTTHLFPLPHSDRAVEVLYGRLLRPLYTRPAQAALGLLTAVGGALFTVRLLGGHVHFLGYGAAPILLLLLPVAIALQLVLHELAHAATCKHFGRKVWRAGVGWYMFMPVAYVDTSDMWPAPRGQRIAVSWAGPYTNLIVGATATLAASAVAGPYQDFFYQLAAAGFVIGLLNLNPLLELDGYYVLMDWLEVPNLRAKALAHVGTLIWRAGPDTEDAELGRIFTVFGALAVAYTVFTSLAIVVTYDRDLGGLGNHLLPGLMAHAPGLMAHAPGLMLGAVFAAITLWSTWGQLRPGARPAGG